MFQALFNSLSGLFSFSKSLDTVSHNVANMNTPGFRGSDSFFSNISGGRGTRITGEGMRTQAGDIRQTGNPTDLAVDGGGYFILRDADGNLSYTRAGQFRFDGQDRLIDSATNLEVMAIGADGMLTGINLQAYRSIPPEVTTRVQIKGNLAPGSATASLNNIIVYDAAGVAHTLSATFTNNTSNIAGSFLVSFKNEAGTVVHTGEVRFATNGSPLSGFNEMALTLTYGSNTQTVTLGFGTAGAFDGLTALSGVTASLTSKPEDGHGMLGVTSLSFDERGILRLVYTQSEERSGPQIALALLSNESALKLFDGRLIPESTVAGSELGRAGEGSFGRVTGGSLEQSNVDLTQEFADMIVIQRGYQASSRVMTITNEMIEQLYNSTRGS